MSGPPPAIQLKGLCKRFGPKVVLDDLDLDVAKGRSTVVIGGSGTGKSVMLKCILGLLKPDAGDILVDGVSVVTGSAKDKKLAMDKIGMLFQGAALFDSMSVWENVAFQLLQDKTLTSAQAREIAIENLSLVGMSPDNADLNPASLSVGQQKRVGLARAIATKPDILFFDEPTTGLDPLMADVIDELIVDVVSRLGATTLTITHDMASAKKIGHHIALLYQGKILWQGAADMVDNSGNPYVDQFIHGQTEGPIQLNL